MYCWVVSCMGPPRRSSDHLSLRRGRTRQKISESILVTWLWLTFLSACENEKSLIPTQTREFVEVLWLCSAEGKQSAGVPLAEAPPSALGALAVVHTQPAREPGWIARTPNDFASWRTLLLNPQSSKSH